MKKFMNITLVAAAVVVAAIALSACGVKRYEQPARCDDLSMSFYNDINPATLSDGQKSAVTRFASLQGNWTVTFSCIDQEDASATLVISEAISSNVELYEFVDNAECESYGKAVFEARVSNSGDMDLDDSNFILTADLMVQDEYGGNFLESQSVAQASHNAEFQSFNFRVAITEEGEFVATKEVTVSSGPNSSSVVVTRRNECFLTDWVAQ